MASLCNLHLDHLAVHVTLHTDRRRAPAQPDVTAMAENGQREDGVSLTGIAYDKDLYGGNDMGTYVPSIGVADEEEQDEREQALRRRAASLLRFHYY